MSQSTKKDFSVGQPKATSYPLCLNLQPINTASFHAAMHIELLHRKLLAQNICCLLMLAE